MIVTAAPAGDDEVSALVATVKDVAGYVAAVDGFVTPPIVSEAAELASSAHVPPLFASVTVTVVDELVADALQPENPAPGVAVGPEIAKEGWKVTLIVPPAASAPLAPDVKSTVHDEVLLAVSGAPVNATPPTPEVMVTAVARALAVLSRFVETVNPTAAYAPAGGFVIPAIVTEASVFAASAHVPPEFARVIVTMPDEAAPVPEQAVKPDGSVIAGAPGITKFELNVTVMVSPLASAPAALDRKPTVQVVEVPEV